MSGSRANCPAGFLARARPCQLADLFLSYDIRLSLQAPLAAALDTTGVQAASVQATERVQPQAAAAQAQPVGAAAGDVQAEAAPQQAARASAAAEQQPVPARGAAATTTAAGLGTVDDLYRCADKLGNATIVEQLPQLKIEQELSTNKARSPQDVTLVTQLSFERLYMLEGQCDVWNGVISAAVYIALLNGKVVTVELNSNQDPRLTDISEVEAKFKQFHQLAEAKGERGGGCWEWGQGGGRQAACAHLHSQSCTL